MNRYILLILIVICFSLVTQANANELLKDDLADTKLKEQEIAKPNINTNYNYLDTDCVIIPIKITKKISTAGKYKTLEGNELEFFVSEDVYYNEKLLVSKDTKVTAKVEILTTKGISGIPGEISISDFQIPGLDSSKILEPVTKRGQNRTLWILPVKWALTPLPPLGSFTNIIVGGDGVIKPSHTLKLHYYPNW